MDNLVPLNAVQKNTRSQDVVNLLKDLLKRAEEGHIVSLGYVTVNNDGTIGQGWHRGTAESFYPLITASAILQDRLIRNIQGR